MRSSLQSTMQEVYITHIHITNIVKCMEVDERPVEDYTDIGGLENQIEELREAVVLPITHKERFENIGIRYIQIYI